MTGDPGVGAGGRSVIFAIPAASDAIPDNYEIDLQVNYTLFDPLGGNCSRGPIGVGERREDLAFRN